MSRDRDEGGKFTRRVTDDDVLRALREHPEPVATAGDLADVLGVTSETVRRHLGSLRERGAVERKSVGARAVVWWASRDGNGEEAPAAPLRDLVGMLAPEAAEAARERSREWRDEFDRTMAPEDG